MRAARLNHIPRSPLPWEVAHAHCPDLHHHTFPGAQAVLGRCLGGQYAPVLRKLLRCAEALPFGRDDLHMAASAHGSFADVLKQLASQHLDAEVRHYLLVA